MKKTLKIKDKIFSMNISTKLRIISSVALIIPLALSTICCVIIYLTFVTGEYSEIINMLEPIENTHYSYMASEYIYEEFKKQVDNNSEIDMTKLFIDDAKIEQGIVYLELKKNDEIIYHTVSYEKPENFEQLYSLVDNNQEKVYAIIEDNIVFRITLQKDGDTYSMFAHGPVRTFIPYEKTPEFYIGFLLTNFIFIVIVAVAVLILSKILNKAVFNRVEYSLKILSNGVQRISEGDLDYRIDYKRDDEFKPICNSFNNMAEKLEESVALIQRQDKNQREIILGITHDIFSPLTSIKAYVEGLQGGIANTKDMQKKYLDIINTKAEQIEKTVSQMLLYSKTKDNIVDANYSLMDFSEYIKSYVESNKTDYSMKNVDINILRCDKTLIKGDKILLARMITNIIDNSQKYSDKIKCTVDIELFDLKEKCRLVISDDGPGVDEKNTENLFDMFYVGDKARQNPGKSNGIGLSIVYNIVTKIHGGTVRAENRNGGGLKIIIELPTVKED